MVASIRRLFLLAFVIGSAAAILLTAVSRPAGAQTSSVGIVNYAFHPNSLTVPVGATVTWTNNGTVAHTVTSDTGAFDAGAISPGSTFSFTFTTAGTYTYHCDIHPFMTGSVQVTGGASTVVPAVVPSPTLAPLPPTNTPVIAAPTSTPVPTATATPTIAPAPTSTNVPAAPKAHFALHVVSLPSRGKSGVLRLKVTNRTSHKPVPRASVRVDGRAIGVAKTLTRRTDRQGTVAFRNFKPAHAGAIVLHVSKSGFASSTTKVQVH